MTVMVLSQALLVKLGNLSLYLSLALTAKYQSLISHDVECGEDGIDNEHNYIFYVTLPLLVLLQVLFQVLVLVFI